MRALLLLAVASLAGCGATAPVVPTVEYKTVTVNTACTSFRKITGHPSDLTAMSDDVKRQIAAHNAAWDKACPAKAPSPH